MHGASHVETATSKGTINTVEVDGVLHTHVLHLKPWRDMCASGTACCRHAAIACWPQLTTHVPLQVLKAQAHKHSLSHTAGRPSVSVPARALLTAALLCCCWSCPLVMSHVTCSCCCMQALSCACPSGRGTGSGAAPGSTWWQPTSCITPAGLSCCSTDSKK